MFNKRNEPEDRRAEEFEVPPMSAPRAPAAAPPAPTGNPRPSGTPSCVGATLRIRGDLSGDEDLVVQGALEGTVELRKNQLTVGKDGSLNATVHARVIEVEGRVEGDLHGEERVVLRGSANVKGNIVAPRVSLEDGCRFKGAIDMEPVGAVEPSQKRGNVAGFKSLKNADSAVPNEAPKTTGA